MRAPGSIDAEFWKRIDALLQVALTIPAEERSRWLDSLDPELLPSKATLMELLARAESETGAFMGQPVGAQTVEAAVGVIDEDKPGDIVGPYRLLRQLGEGGMGTVWSAERVDGTLRRRVALKLPRSGWSPGLAERLKRECEILSALEHPAIARLYDAGLTSNGRPYLAMESIEGIPIDEYCRARELPLPARLRLFVDVANAISYAHARLVVHLDLKPSNILVDAEGGVHVVDFGLAKLLDSSAGRQGQLTQLTGQRLTPDFASPEQIRGETLTVGSDVYSLGVVLYVLLTGKRPYTLRRESPAALEEAIIEADIPPASSQAEAKDVARQLRGDLDTILAKALRKNLAERYPSVDAFAADIQRHLSGRPVLARPDSFFYSAGKFVRRKRGIVLAGGLIAVAVLAGFAATLYQTVQARAERDKAIQELSFSEATEEFMLFLLSDQSPKPLSSHELLGKAEQAAGEQFATQALLRARMQIAISDAYRLMTDLNRAKAVLDEAKRSAAASGDPDVMAQVDCSLAFLMLTLGNSEESQSLFNAVMPKLESGELADPRTRRICYAQRSLANNRLGRVQASADDAKVAMASMESRPGQAANRIALSAQVALALVEAGRTVEAAAIHEQGVRELARMGRGNSSAGLILTNNLMVILIRAGQLRRAEEVYGLVPASGERVVGIRSSLGTIYARLLVGLGRAREAQPLLDDALGEKIRLGDKRGEAYVLIVAAMAACALDEIVKCEALVASAEAKAAPVFPPANSHFATLRMLSAKVALARGDTRKAMDLLHDAVSRYQATADKNPLLASALSLLAETYQRTGDEVRAKLTAEKAVETARVVAGDFPTSECMGAALLAQAAIYKAQGNPVAARKIALEARDQLAASVGADAPAVAQADALIRSIGG